MKKCECGNQVADNAKTCPKCGHRFTSGAVKIVAWIFGILVGLIVLSAIISTQTGDSPSFNTGNVGNDKLLVLPESKQAAILGETVNQSCVGDRAFYMGIGRTDHKAFWSVQCTNGASWAVEIPQDENESTRVLECSVLRAIVGVDCFQKFEGR